MRRFLAGLLIGVGWLIAGTTGLCTGAMLVADTLDQNGEFSSLVLPLVIGGVPCGLGVVMIYAGWRLWRSEEP